MSLLFCRLDGLERLSVDRMVHRFLRSETTHTHAGWADYHGVSQIGIGEIEIERMFRAIKVVNTGLASMRVCGPLD